MDQRRDLGLSLAPPMLQVLGNVAYEHTICGTCAEDGHRSSECRAEAKRCIVYKYSPDYKHGNGPRLPQPSGKRPGNPEHHRLRRIKETGTSSKDDTDGVQKLQVNNESSKMVPFAILALALSLRCITAYHPYEDLATPLGNLKGSIMKTGLGKTIYAFRGIRYAEAPVGKLRFQPPVPVDSWNGTYDATRDGAACPQPDHNDTSEDCLFLNVYTTELDRKKLNPLHPVVVFIHASAYRLGSGRSDALGPDYLLEQKIVLVVFNYRLASLGFMSTGDKIAPGNNGLKDQVVALRWVKDNIAAFGGNPDLVTLSGYSAGGSSVSLHLVSPMSKGLFHRAVIMSGSSFGNWPVPSHRMELAKKEARFLGCPDNDSSVIYKCLVKKDAKEIANVLREFNTFPFDSASMWGPVIEPDCGQERFLTDNPVKLFLEGKYQKVPVMAGIASEETEFAAYGLLNNATWFKKMDEDFEEVAPIAFIYERGTENSKRISREFRKFYLGDEPLSNDSLPQLGKLYADGLVGFSVNRAVKLLSLYSSKSTYYYRFSYRGRYSFHLNPNTQKPEGVVHQDDLMYLFYISRFPRFIVLEPEYAMVQKLAKLWHNFAVTGKPIDKRSLLFNDVLWKPITPKENVYLDIGKRFVFERRSISRSLLCMG
ncbi:hypothetical protein FQA39_LY00167 [Lamprigera yunnana]|nr:hypothetical protein FQA39_LY00167 [Lamprigera yunnana]